MAVIFLENMLAAYFEGKQISIHKLSYSKNTLNVNKEHYKSMYVKQSFDIENTLLHSSNIVDYPEPKHTLVQYDACMGCISL